MVGSGDDDKDDAALWAKVVESAAPLKRKRALRHPIGAKPRPVPPAPPKAKPKPIPVPRAAEPPPPARPRAPAKAPLDRKTARELDKGRLEVEARLDLHGLRQRDAHAALKRFIKEAQARGRKHVLIITGKGAALTASQSFYAEEERGVLRNAVPLWLAEPELAALIVSVSPAPRRLGGDGALYVRVRRARKWTET
jgi:DNA-nicking Smr family endonuclease